MLVCRTISRIPIMTVSQSDMGFQTRIWSFFWHILHMISLNYPVRPSAREKEQYLEFFKSLQWVLPCKSCRQSYGKFIRAKGRTRLNLKTMESRESVARWMYNIHCAVSKRIGKRTPISFEGMCRRYEKFRATSCSDHTCDTQMHKRRRAVVLIMDDTTYNRMGFKSSLVVM